MEKQIYIHGVEGRGADVQRVLDMFGASVHSYNCNIPNNIYYLDDGEVCTASEGTLMYDLITTHPNFEEVTIDVLVDVYNKTYKDLEPFAIAGYLINYVEEPFIKGMFREKYHASSALAMAQISQLMPYYGGEIEEEEWLNQCKPKYVISRYNNKPHLCESYCKYEFLAFHTQEQRDAFYKNNEDLVMKFLMVK